MRILAALKVAFLVAAPATCLKAAEEESLLYHQTRGQTGPAIETPDIVYNHIAKTGGTFLSEVLEHVVKGGKTVVRHEQDTRDRNDKQSFTIGSIRNPCDYYVSWWAYICPPTFELHWLWAHVASCTSDTKNSPEDISNFRSFMENVHDGSTLGEESIRFALSYVNDGKVGSMFSNHKGMPINPSTYTPLELYYAGKALRRFNTSKVDCWVRTERMVEDTRRCLQLFEAGKGRKRIDWELFESKAQSAAHNPSGHASCREYYNSNTEGLVRSLDSTIWEKFGYTRCCE